MSTPTATAALADLSRRALIRALVVLLIVACVGAVIVGIIAAGLTPADTSADGGRSPAANITPELTRVPSRVETNGAPLDVTVHAGTARIDPGSRVTRYIVTAQPPNGAPLALCDSPTETDCMLHLDGSPSQRGIWVFTLAVYDETGAVAQVRERMRVA